jgi:hypothetical protein
MRMAISHPLYLPQFLPLVPSECWKAHHMQVQAQQITNALLVKHGQCGPIHPLHVFVLAAARCRRAADDCSRQPLLTQSSHPCSTFRSIFLSLG